MPLNKVVTTYSLPLQTVRKGDIQEHLTNPDTMSTLVSDTLVSRAEPTLRMDRHHTNANIRILEHIRVN